MSTMKIRVAPLGLLLALAAVLAVFAHDEARAADRSDTHQSASTWSAQPTTLVDTQELTFKSGEATLSGALYAPKVEGRIPAVIVFHSASAPTRDNPLSRSPQAAFAIAASAPMTTPDVQMNFAVANILRIRGFSQADIDQAIGARTAVDDFIRGKRDRASTQGIVDVASTKPWFQHIYVGKTFKDPDQSRWAKEMRHDPLSTLDAVKQPVLVIYGSTDPWVPAQISSERLRASSPQHPNVDVVVITGADHAMATSVSAVDQIDPVISAKEAPQATQYFALLGAWLARHGIASIP